MKKPKACEACNGTGWLLMAGGWGISGTKADFKEILRRLKNDPEAVGMEVQRCDLCGVFASDEDAKEKASILLEVKLVVMFDINGYVTNKTLAQALVENALLGIQSATNNDTDWYDVIDSAKVVEYQTEGKV